MKPDDKQRNYERAEELLAEQNFAAALIGGAVAMVLGAAFYGIVTASAGFTYGFAAVAIGMAVGGSMQYLGRGIEAKFATAAAIYTSIGCLLGNVFKRVLPFLANGGSLAELFEDIAFSDVLGWAVRDVSVIDLVFWLVGIWFAIFLVKRSLSRVDRLAIGMYQMKH